MTGEHSQTELTAMVYKAVNATRAVMVGIAGDAASHFHPMKGHTVQGERALWFICRRDISLVQDLGGETKPAIVNVISEDHHLHASLNGRLTAERDQGRLDQFWSSVVDAWLPEGRLSQDVILLHFEPGDAEIWISDNAFKLAWEVAKANFNRETITSGEKASVTLG